MLVAAEEWEVKDDHANNDQDAHDNHKPAESLLSIFME
jgi:hypothetical protein